MPSSYHTRSRRRRTKVKGLEAMIFSLVTVTSRPRSHLLFVRAWTTTTTSARTTIARTSHSPRTAFSTAARRWSDHEEDGHRPSSYSLEDLEAVMAEREMPPPNFVQGDMEEGYGAYDYRPDLYETDYLDDHAATTEPAIPEELLMEAPVRDDDDDVAAFAGKQPSQPSAEPDAAPAAAPNTFLTEDESHSEDTADPPSSSTPLPSPISSFQGVEQILADTPPSGEDVPTAAPARTTLSYTHVAVAAVDAPTQEFLKHSAARGGPVTTDLEDMREVQLPEIIQQIYQQNNGQEFNINSPKQVSQVLFGIKDKSTNKEALEGMAAGGNRMADLILQYRRIKATVKRLEKRAENTAKGTLVRSVSTVVRPTTNATVPVATNYTRREEGNESSDPLLLVDASSYIFRAYFSMPPIHRSDGMPTGAVMGFCNMLNRLVMNRLMDGEQPRMILAFDAPGPSFRKDLYPDYKANRPEAPMDLIPQFALIRQASAAYGIPIVEAPGFEADDVIATLASRAHSQGLDVHILSGDKDLMQLITGPDVVPCINMIDPLQMSRIAHAEVVEKWGVGPDLLGDVLALAGDTADNIPGVPGIGPKIAGVLLGEYGSLENLLENAGDIKQNSRREKLLEFAHLARLSRALVALEDAVPGIEQQTGDLSQVRTEPFDSERILAFYDEMQFRDVKRRFLNQLQRGAPKKRPKSNRKDKVDIPRPEDFADVPF